jgi:hypothetical protein
MVRPSIDLDTYKEEITTIFNQQKTNNAIRQEFAYRYCRTKVVDRRTERSHDNSNRPKMHYRRHLQLS